MRAAQSSKGLDLGIFEARVEPYVEAHSLNLATLDIGGRAWKQIEGDLEAGRDASLSGYIPGWRLVFPSLGLATRIESSDDLGQWMTAAQIIAFPPKADPDDPSSMWLNSLSPADRLVVWRDLIRSTQPGQDPEDRLWAYLEAGVQGWRTPNPQPPARGRCANPATLKRRLLR